MLKMLLGGDCVDARRAGAQAQDWPTRPVTMVVPYAAGGPVDNARPHPAARLSEFLGQQVIIENVGGAGGMTGIARVAKAAPDGYTFLLAGSGTMAQDQTLYKKPLYDSATDFTPVGLVDGFAARPAHAQGFPAKNCTEFIAYAKANQAKLQYGSAGVGSGSHVCSLLLDQAMGTKITHVPYRGAAPAMQDVIAGPSRLSLRADFDRDAASRGPQREGARIARTGPRPVLPDLPAMRENGLPDFDCGAWGAFVFPKGTPAAIVSRLAHAANDTVETPAVVEHLAKVGVTITPKERRTPEFLAKYILSRDRALGAADQGERGGFGLKPMLRGGKTAMSGAMFATAAFALTLAAVPANAQDWPTRPITLIVPFAAGGPVDVAARLLAPHISEILGQQIIIENVGGAGGMTGSYRVAKSPPDGYTFVFGTSGTHASNQTLFKKPLYNAATDFAPVGVVFENTKVLLARNSLPAKTMPEFVAYLKANHDKMQFGSAGVGSATHLGCVLLNQDRHQHHPRALSRLGAGDAGSHCRADRLRVRGDFDRDAADRSRNRSSRSRVVDRARRGDAGFADGA